MIQRRAILRLPFWILFLMAAPSKIGPAITALKSEELCWRKSASRYKVSVILTFFQAHNALFGMRDSQEGTAPTGPNPSNASAVRVYSLIVVQIDGRLVMKRRSPSFWAGKLSIEIDRAAK